MSEPSLRKPVRPLLDPGAWRSVVLAAAVATQGCNLFESEVPDGPASCVEDVEVARKAQFDGDAEFTGRVTATLVGTVLLEQTAKKLDLDVAQACESIVRDLGGELPEAGAEGKRTQVACRAAIEQIKASREKAGAIFVVDLKPPMCSARTSDFERCARECDRNLIPGFQIGCAQGATSGRCEGRCTGTCVENASEDCGATCRGTCEGRCMEGFFGRCGGKCIGDCDGKTVNGKCEGTCDGKCTSDAQGVCATKCQGKCAGVCLTEVKKKKCEQVCAGTCSETPSDPRCGEIIPPDEMSPECRAQCDADVSSRLACTAGHADVTVFSAADREKAELLRAALGRGFTRVLNVEQGPQLVLTRSAEGLQSSLEALEESASESPEGQDELASCFEAAREKQKQARAAVEAISETSVALVAATKP